MSKSTMCMKCGSTSVFWHENRNGKWVLCTGVSNQYENGTGSWIEPHICDGAGISDEVLSSNYTTLIETIFTADADAKIDVINGQLKSIRKALGDNTPEITVEVFKGRKVPVGTVGQIVWVGVDSYGSIKVGIKDSNNETHFTAITNVKVGA